MNIIIVIYNLITLCRYCMYLDCLEFENIDIINAEYNLDNEPVCNCSLCYNFRNCILFTTNRLKYKEK